MANVAAAPMIAPMPTVDIESVSRRSGPCGQRWCSVSAPMHFGHVAIRSDPQDGEHIKNNTL